MLDGDSCPNWLCTDPNRRIARIRAIAYLSGPLRKTILKYKYDGRSGWSLIFGRLLVAWLDRNVRQEPPDLIIANPTFLGEGGAPFGHTERVLDTASKEDVLGEWPFDITDPRVLTKVEATAKSAGQNAAAKRAAAAELLSALRLIEPEQIEGRRILVYDDVCTTGSQLNTVAGFLIDEGGAAHVEGIVLARQPWHPRS
jgi:predicted amidophosphoribosyltransferase